MNKILEISTKNVLLCRKSLNALNDKMLANGTVMDIKILCDIHHECLPTTIDFSGENIGDDALALIAFGLHYNMTVTSLDISHNKVCDIKTICNLLKNNDTLTKLKVTVPVLVDTQSKAYNVTLSINTAAVVCNMSSKWINDNGEFQRSYNMIGNTGAVILSAMLYHNKNVKKLDISNSNVLDVGIIAVSDCLKNNATLLELDLSNNFISLEGALKLKKAIEFNVYLLKLNLSMCMVSGCAGIICSSLVCNTTLLELDLSYNKISIADAREIAHIIYVNTTLQTLNISYCHIPDNEVVLISNSYKSNKTLHQLIISWNKDQITVNTADELCDVSRKDIGYTGALIVSNLLFNNLKVKKVDISYNNLSDDEAIAISNCLKNNYVLQQISMSGNNITAKGKEEIQRLFGLKRT